MLSFVPVSVSSGWIQSLKPKMSDSSKCSMGRSDSLIETLGRNPQQGSAQGFDVVVAPMGTSI